MPSTGNVDTSTPPAHPGWLVVDPTQHPYAWYSLARACDAATAMSILEPDAALRGHMLGRGWSVRAGAGTELLAPGKHPEGQRSHGL